MTIHAESLRPGLQAFAREQAPTMNRLRKALEILYRDRAGGRTIEEITEIVLLTVARAHERRSQGALDSLNRSLGRVLADVEATRTAGGGAQLRGRALREADLRTISRAVDDLMTFEAAVKKRIAEHDEALGRAVEDALAGSGAAGHAALNKAVSRGEDVLKNVRETLDAWTQGYTLPERGVRYKVSDPSQRSLTDAMRRLEEALDTYRRNPGTDAVSAAAAVDRLQREWATANEKLRQSAGDFDVVVHGDVMPGRPRPPDAPPLVGAAAEAAARAWSIRDRFTATPSLADLPRAQLVDELQLVPLEALAEGSLREPVPRGGGEKVQMRPPEIGRLWSKAILPKLATRLAALFDGWQRAHLIGPGFGSELAEGVMLAPWGINQLVQNKGFEEALRGAQGAGADIPLTARAKGRRLAIPLRDGTFEVVDVLESVHYEIPRAGGGDPIRLDITVHPDGSWSATHHGSLDQWWPKDVPLAGTR